MNIGYARTSTIEQEASFEAQRMQLMVAGCDKVFCEQVSAVSSERDQLEAALDYAREGDVLVVTKLDRLARSVPHLCEIGKHLDAKGCELVAEAKIFGSSLWVIAGHARHQGRTQFASGPETFGKTTLGDNTRAQRRYS